MLEIVTTDEFANWFAALDDRAAEDVAAALEMVEKLGPHKTALDSSEWLLWYEEPDAPEIVLADDWAEFHDAAKELVARLESPRFAAKLRRLPAEDAGRVMVALDVLGMASAARRRGLAMVAARAWRGRSADDPYAALRRAYRTVVAAAGLASDDFTEHSTALRELTLRSPASRLRLLYGVDVQRQLALVVLGERLERRFYGDSVRRAERVWQQFLQQKKAEAGNPAPSR
jgi:hypothetical protein